MVPLESVFICYLIPLYSSDSDGICSKSEKNDILCCADYYRDFVSGSCSPCIGSFGHNCSLKCRDGFFGHGCRSTCNCTDIQICEPHRGCTQRSDGSNSTIGTNYTVVALACVLSFFIIGTALFKCRKLQHRFKTNSDDDSSIERSMNRMAYVNASSSRMIGNAAYPSTHYIQSKHNLYDKTNIDHCGNSQEYQLHNVLSITYSKADDHGYSESGTSDHLPSQGNDRKVLPSWSKITDDSICDTKIQKGAPNDKISDVYMHMEYNSMKES